jgi:hypothetical protein
MRILARTVLLLLSILPVLVIAVVWSCFQDAPSVVRNIRLTPQDIETAKRIIDQHDLRKPGHGGTRTVVISEQDLDLMLNYAANRFGRGAARAALRPGTVRLQASAEIPQSPFGRFVNIDAALRETGTLPRFDHLRIGGLRVPAVVADYLLREGLRRIATTGRGQREPHSDIRLERRNPGTPARRTGFPDGSGAAARVSGPARRDGGEGTGQGLARRPDAAPVPDRPRT